MAKSYKPHKIKVCRTYGNLYKDIKKWISKNLQKMEQKDERGEIEKNVVSRGLVRLFEEEGYRWG